MHDIHLEKKVQPTRLHPGAVLENDATLEGGAIFSLILMFRNSSTFESGAKIVPWAKLRPGLSN